MTGRPLRHTSQELLPLRKGGGGDGCEDGGRDRGRDAGRDGGRGGYDIYPTHPLGGPVEQGYPELARWLSGSAAVILDGYGGVFWQEVRRELETCLEDLGIETTWLDVAEAMRPSQTIESLVGDYVGDDPVFGRRYPGELRDLFDGPALAALRPDPASDLTIVYGCGAALVDWDAALVYLDVPKNEIQFRSRAGSIGNLGAAATDAKAMYKRFYFVDWPLLDRHKRELLPRIDVMIDSQRPGRPTFAGGADLRAALGTLARSHFRVRPWFEPGAWGGQWIRERIAGLNRDVPNYAWSFELITPENGLIFEGDDLLLEVSFDLLMYQEAEAVLGTAHARFGEEFPIRFDLLDTVEGGNLSVQCHPRPAYIREHFGESFTQDETYYILDCAPGAMVYLGFEEGVDPAELRRELERSQRDGVAIDIGRFVHARPSRRHELYLIPSGTVHCAGSGNLVLEISATPYIFTFKLYDWMRLDLDGRPRPINIERAFENLDFGRAGAAVDRELISRPQVIDRGDDWLLERLPTHHEHFYDVSRYTFDGEVSVGSDGACHVMSLVGGRCIRLVGADGSSRRFGHAETFVVPAAAGGYRLVNEGEGPAMVVRAHVRHPG